MGKSGRSPVAEFCLRPSAESTYSYSYKNYKIEELKIKLFFIFSLKKENNSYTLTKVGVTRETEMDTLAHHIDFSPLLSRKK